jgi:hypothetical protein
MEKTDEGFLKLYTRLILLIIQFLKLLVILAPQCTSLFVLKKNVHVAPKSGWTHSHVEWTAHTHEPI